MTPADLRRIGEALYGERWQTPLAEALGVADRTVRRWLDGSRSIPETLPDDLARLVRARMEILCALLRSFAAAA